MKNCMTQDEAKQIIERHKGETNYFSGNIDISDMWDMFRYRYEFGEAETAVILASLVRSGAKFKGKLK